MIQARRTKNILAGCVLVVMVSLGAVGMAETAATSAEHAETGTPVARNRAMEKADLYDLASAPRKVRKVLVRAAGFARRGNIERAVEILVGSGQDHYLVELHLAQELADLGRMSEALDHYRRAVTLEPDLAKGWYGLADAAYKLERYAEAAEAFATGYAVDPEKPVDVLYFSGTARLQAGDFSAAAAVFSDLIDQNPASAQLRWYQGLVAAAVRTEKPASVAAAVDEMQALFPEDPTMWYLRYQYSVAIADYRSAAVALNLVGFLRPLRPDEQRQLGDLYTLAGVPALAANHYRAGMEDKPETRQFERLVSSLIAAHELDEAQAALRQALAREETPTLVSLLADIHYMRKDYNSARKEYAHLAELQPANGRAWLMQGYCALELGQKEAALDLLATASNYSEQADMAQLLIQRALKM